MEPGIPKELFTVRTTGVRLRYQVTADGSRFLVNLPADDRPDAPLQVVVNWEGLLKKK